MFVAKWAKDRPLYAAIAVVTVFLCVMASFFRPRFETNDDVIMNVIVAGRAVTDVPDEHLVYSNVLIGIGLKNLYQVMPDVPWYGLYLYTTEIAALTAICYSFFSANPSGKQALFVAAYLVVFALPSVVAIQFTSAAFLAAEAGLLLLVVGAKLDKRACKWFAIPFVILACLIRFDACLLACVVFVPALADAFIRLSPTQVKWSSVIFLGTCLATGWGFSEFNRLYYARSEGWSDFYEFNHLRNQFIDFQRVDLNERTKTVIDSVGWSAVDLKMLRQWGFANSERFSKEKMRKVLADIHLGDRAPRDWQDFVEIFTRGDVFALLVTGLGCTLLMGGSYQSRIVPLASLAIAVLVCTVLFSFYFLPHRVSFPTLSAFVAVAITWSTGRWSLADLNPRTLRGRCRVGLVLVAAILLSWRLSRDVILDSRHGERHAKAIRMMADLAPRHDRLYVVWRDCMPWENLVSPLESLSLSPELKIVGFSTMLPTPFTQNRCREFGIQDIDRALFERNDVILLSNPELNTLFQAYAAEHYRVKLEVRQLFSHADFNNVPIYKLIELTPIKDSAKE